MRIFLHNAATEVTYELSMILTNGPPEYITYKDVPYRFVGQAGVEARYTTTER